MTVSHLRILCVGIPRGGFYGASDPEIRKKRGYKFKYPFIDDNDGPFNSYERGANVRSDYHPKKTVLKIKHLHVYREGHREGNDQGEIAKEWWTWHVRWNGQVTGIHMFKYCVSSFWRAWRRWRKDKDNHYWGNEVADMMKRRKSEKRWWALSSAWLLRKVFRGTWKEVKKRGWVK
jgi:hypothetical protein